MAINRSLKNNRCVNGFKTINIINDWHFGYAITKQNKRYGIATPLKQGVNQQQTAGKNNTFAIL